MTHFTPDTLAFLDELKAVNSKEWYNEHKAEFESFVGEPMKALTERLSGFMLSIDPPLRPSLHGSYRGYTEIRDFQKTNRSFVTACG